MNELVGCTSGNVQSFDCSFYEWPNGLFTPNQTMEPQNKGYISKVLTLSTGLLSL